MLGSDKVDVSYGLFIVQTGMEIGKFNDEDSVKPIAYWDLINVLSGYEINSYVSRVFLDWLH